MKMMRAVLGSIGQDAVTWPHLAAWESRNVARFCAQEEEEESVWEQQAKVSSWHLYGGGAWSEPELWGRSQSGPKMSFKLAAT